MSVETWLIVAVIVFSVAAVAYYIVDKNKDDFKKKQNKNKQNKKIFSERMSIAKRSAENKRKEKLMVKKAMKTTMAIGSPKLSPAAAKIKEQMKKQASFFHGKVIQENKRRMNTENFRRKEMMTAPSVREHHKPYSISTPVDLSARHEDASYHATVLAGGPEGVFTNEHITPTYGGVKKFSGHGQTAGDHIRGDINVSGKGVFPGQSPQHSTLPVKKGFMQL